MYTRDMRRTFDFPELMQLDSVWDYNDDDQNNEIYGIYVDAMVKNKLDIYIVYANCLIKKFSSPLHEDSSTEL